MQRPLALPQQSSAWQLWASQVLNNPGQLYNAGNAVAITAALWSAALLALARHLPVAAGVGDFFFGSLPALLATAASIVFWVSGLRYAQAWKNGFPPDQSANSAGHALSTIGAVLIGLALIAMARSEVSLALAIIATILHVGGKCGSWLAPHEDAYFKPMPFYSRVPYVTSLCLDIRADWLHQGGAVTTLLPAALILAATFWARADWLLLPRTRQNEPLSSP